MKEKGAKDVYLAATHAIFSGPAVDKLKDNSIKEVIVTNTIDIPKEKRFGKLKVVSLAKLLADSITKVYEGTPMGVLFDDLYNKIEEKVIGSFEQYPIKLAWAITIHKSQGQTFDNIVIDLGDGAFSHGQVYVGLSRCTSLKGIILKRPVIESDIIFDKRIYEFKDRFLELKRDI